MFEKFSAVTALSAGMLLAASAFAAPSVELQTSLGKVVIELNAEKAPKTVQNFLHYAKEDFYNGTVFHRVIDGFMIQGGGFTPNMQQKPASAAIVNEARNGLKNERGSVAMARGSDPDSATSQFFINLVNNGSQLDYPQNGGYAVFGKVTQGMDVVDKIAKVATGDRAIHQDVPLQPIVIQSVNIISVKK